MPANNQSPKLQQADDSTQMLIFSLLVAIILTVLFMAPLASNTVSNARTDHKALQINSNGWQSSF
jgi:hypothetical protein